VLYRLTDTVVDVLDVAATGIMLADANGELHFVAASDARAEGVERHEDRLREGPSHHVWSTGEPVAVVDLGNDRRWPTYARHALRLGLVAVGSWPLQAHGQRIGIFNVYCERPRRWTDEEMQAAAVLRRYARSHNARIHDVASAVVRGELTLKKE
jgi:GAF domain-containing protein